MTHEPQKASPDPLGQGGAALPSAVLSEAPILMSWGDILRQKARKLLDPVPVLGIVGALALWYLAAWVIGRYMPAPHLVFFNAFENLYASKYFHGIGLPNGGYLPHLIYTTSNVLICCTIGILLGCFSGVASARWDKVDYVTDPIITLFGTVPILVAAPFFLIWFGLVATAQIILVVFYTTVMMHIYSIQAVRNLHPKYTEYARTLGAGNNTVFRRVTIPGILPEVFGGIRVSFAASWGLDAIAELLGAPYGVGAAILAFESVYDVTSLVAIIFLLGIVALAMDGLLMALRAYLTRWMETESRS